MPDPLTGRYDVLLYVQHLLGIGHVRRAAVLARAFQRSGMKVVLVTGGLPVKGLGLEEIEAVQLPPARSRDETFAVILDENDQPIDDIAANMGEQQVRRLPVMNRDKRLVGIVALGDLAKTATPQATSETLSGISGGEFSVFVTPTTTLASPPEAAHGSATVCRFRTAPTWV